ncbi:MAG: LptF/LptG family permease [Phycisphaerales bacterium]
MPLTLFRYIFKDVLKLLALSTGVLVMVMSVGFIIKPISEGTLGATALAKLIFFVMPGMLSYALPISAAFSATMVYFRLSADNEITACAVSGISYRWLLMPVAMLGVGLTLAMFFLANWIIPIFWGQVEQLIQRDVAQMVVQQIDHQQVVRLNKIVVYADRAQITQLDPPPRDQRDKPWPYQRIVLEHAAGGKIEPDGDLDVDYTGELAVADFYRIEDKTYATIKFTNATVKDPRSGLLVSVKEQGFPAQEIPNLFQTRPQFLSWGRLQRMSENPDLHSKIAELSQNLRDAMAQSQATEDLAQALAGPGDQAEAIGRAVRQGETTTITGGGLLNLVGPQGEEYSAQSPKVKIEDGHLLLLADDDKPVVAQLGGLNVQQRFEAKSGRMEVVPSSLGEEPRINLKLNQVTVRDPRLPTPTQVKTIYLTMLRLPQPVMDPLRAAGSLNRGDSPGLLTLVEREPTKQTVRLAQTLQGQINELRRVISSVVNERAAMAVCTLLVMLLGGSMSMWLRRQTPLMIFFWCFLPAILAILMVSGAKNMIKADAVGLGPWFNAMMIWSGNLFLIAVIGGVYRKLAKH